MTKREFLKELEDRLQMLDEKERKDMIEEYIIFLRVDYYFEKVIWILL